MANNPLDLKEFKHYLNFVNDGVGRIPISEPVKFDGAAFSVEQDTKAYARDITYMAEEIDLEFYEGFFEKGDQYELENGLIVDELGHAIDYLFRYNRDYGFQAQIEYILERNGVEFILGELNFEGAKTDELTYFYCKVVQNTKRALSKRREDTKIDGFATEDLDGNTVTPIQTENVLLQAKPVLGVSEWETVSFDYNRTGANGFYGLQPAATFPVFRNIKESTIKDTLTSFYDVKEERFGTSGTDFFEESIEDLRFIRAETELSNIKLKIKNVNIQCGFSGIVPIQKSLVVRYGSSFVVGEYDIITLFFSDDDNISIVNQDYEVTIPFVPSGGYVQLSFTIFDPYPIPSVTPSSSGNLSILSGGELEITAVSTAVSTVIKAVRYVDLIKQSLKVINGMEITSPDFEVGGKYYDLFAFSGNLIRQRDDVPFYITFKDRRENLALMNADVQINDDDAILVQYDKYYDNVENGVFNLVPDTKFNMVYNKRYACNLLEFEFKNYEKDRDESNTLDAIHTKAQFSINNTRVKNTKKISIDDTFDPFKIESIRRQQFKETTALDGDDKIHALDCIQLAPNSLEGFTTSMTHQIQDNGDLKLLKDAELPSWALLGFDVGSIFNITEGINIGSYTVTEIENTIITLTPSGGTVPTDDNIALTTVSYPLTNVLYTNRTDEGFDQIDNLLNGDNFSNLRYSIRRNLIEWESYISTCAEYISENPKNTEFTNNGELVTQFEGGETYTENGDIDLQTIKEGLVTPRLYDTDVVAEYDDVLDLITKYQQLATIGGFIRVSGNNGDIKKLYPQKLTYTWATKVLNIVGEERNESDDVVINIENGVIIINNVSYDIDFSDSSVYEIVGDYLAIYDNNQIKIINFTRYNEYIVQGETFDNIYDLAQSLINL